MASTTPPATARPAIAKKKLRSIEDLIEAHEEIWNQVQEGVIDPETVSALNGVLKGATYLQVGLKLELARIKLEAAKIHLDSKKASVELPSAMIPNGVLDEDKEKK